MKALLHKYLGALALLLVLPGLVFAQDGALEGTVTDAETGDPLPGANVLVVETQQGTITDADGTFAIPGVEPGEYTVEVTFVGYQTQELATEIGPGEAVTLDVAMEAEMTGLEEVVVTGVGVEQTRGEASVSVSSIDAAEITDAAEFENMTDILQGRTSGVTVRRTSGNVGSGLRFDVRGGVSLNSDGQPLIFIDGTRIEQDPGVGFGVGGQDLSSPLADLDPNNIESINVLKGPAATSLYGTDGTDGVVLIETKSGRFGQDLEVDYRGTFGQATRQGDYNDEIFPTAERLNDIHRTANTQGHRVSVSGSFEETNYQLAYSHRDTESIFPTGNGQRNNVSANFESQPTESFSVSARSTLAFNEFSRPQADNNIFGVLGNLALDAPFGAFSERDSVAHFSIDDEQRVRRFQQSVEVTYTPDAVPGLELRAEGGADISARRNDQTYPNEFEDLYLSDGGERNAVDQDRRRFNADMFATYNYDITPGISATTAGGAQLFTESDRFVSATASEIGTDLIQDIGAGAQVDNVSESVFNTRSAGLIGRQQFQIANRYSVEFSLRRDWSSRLIAGDTGSFTEWYPAARASAQIGEFFPDVVDQFNVRASWGQSGSLPDLVDSERVRYEGSASGFGTGATIGNVGDPDLDLEQITEIEGGFDVGFADRYSLSFTAFFQNTEDSIVDFQPAPSTGFGSFTEPRNVGEIEAWGVELDADVTAVRTQQFSLNFNANYSYRDAEVQDLGGETLFGGFERNAIREGAAPFSFIGDEIDGAEFDEDGNFIGPNVVAEDVVLGNPVPDHFGGFGFTATLFEDLRVNAQAEYQLGHEVYSNTVQFLSLSGINERRNQLQEDLAGLEPGTDEYRSVANDLAETNPLVGEVDNFLQSADFLKLRSVGVQYDFSDLIRSATGTDQVRNFSLGFSAQNLVTFTSYDLGPDPEVNFDGSRGLIRGQDFLTLQNPREYTFTLRVGF